MLHAAGSSTLSLHDALPIWLRRRDMGARVMRTDTAMLDTTGAGRRPTVLIASHQESSSRSLESILGPNGYTVLKAYTRSEEHTSELQSLTNLVCRLLLEKKK